MKVLPTALLVPIFFVLLISGCINLPSLASEKFSIAKEEGYEDLHYAVEIYPSVVWPGKTVKLRILIEPKRDLENVKVVIADPCLFSVEGKKEKFLGNINANTRRYVHFSLKAPEKIDMKTQCEIKLKIIYQANFVVIQDIAVLSEAEEKTNHISISSTALPSALEISVSFSKTQPFLSGEKVFMYLDYRNEGSGIIGELNRGDVKIYLPNNLKLEECSDYSESEEGLILNRNIVFVNGKGKRSACLFRAVANSPVDIETMKISGKYKYEIDENVIVTVERGEEGE